MPLGGRIRGNTAVQSPDLLLKDAQKFKGIVTLDALQDQFDLPGSCKIKGKAKLFCVPAAKTVNEFIVGKQPGQLQQVPGPDVIPDRICYKVKCPVPQVTSELVSDQFGSRQLAGFKPFLLCTPAVKGLPPTSTTSTTLPSSCTSGVECDDGDACTIDTCVAGTCSHAPEANGTVCDDGNVCTTPDTCTDGVCGGTMNPNCCQTAAECDDGDGCTIDTCVGNVCSNSVAPDGTACTPTRGGQGTCQAGQCIAF